jgi:tetratricopeptide (TPR) repeat protein
VVSPSVRSRIHGRLGKYFVEDGDPDQALVHLEQALKAQGDEGADREEWFALANRVADPEEVISMRRRVVDGLDDGGERALALVELGDEWRGRLGDHERGLACYEDALHADPDCRDAYRGVIEASRQLGDWQRVYRASLELARLSEVSGKEADWRIQAARVARDRLWEPDRAADEFRRAYRRDPERIDDAFGEMVELLHQAEDWEGLERAYIEALDSQKRRVERDREFEAILWYRLGELYRLHLEQTDQAVEAFGRASELFPDNPAFHRKIVDLVEEEAEFVDLAIAHLKRLVELEEGAEPVRRLGRAYLRAGDVDRALWHFQWLAFRGEPLSERPRRFVEELNRPVYASPGGTLGEDRRRRRIYPEALDTEINTIFRILYEPLRSWSAERRSAYGLKRSDRLDTEEPLAFNNMLRDVVRALEMTKAPEVWRQEDRAVIDKASLGDRALLVGDALLGDADEREVAFELGRMLFLSLEPFFTVGLRPVSDLQAFLLLAIQLVDPDVETDRSESMDKAYRKVDKHVTGARRNRLAEAVHAATGENGRHIDLRTWLEAVDEAANRVGLFFCDDLNVAAKQMRARDSTISQRGLGARIESLADWSIDEDFLRLRRELGIAVSPQR